MKRPFIMFAINDHMNDMGVRLSPAFARGVWLDMICLMAAGEPYGYLRWDTYTPEPAAPGKGRHGHPHQDPPTVTPPSTPPQRPPRRAPPGENTWTPSTAAPDLPPNGSLETLLPYITNTPAEVVEKAIRVLERYRVFNRVKEGPYAGVIYSRRMKRDEENRQLKSKIAKEAQKRQQEKRKGNGAGGQQSGQHPPTVTPPSTPPQSPPPVAPPGVPPLRTRTRTRDITTTTPLTPPSKGGPTETGSGKPAAQGNRRGRGVFDDEAIRRHAELTRGSRKK